MNDRKAALTFLLGIGVGLFIIEHYSSMRDSFLLPDNGTYSVPPSEPNDIVPARVYKTISK
jgi:hypothetical protein